MEDSDQWRVVNATLGNTARALPSLEQVLSLFAQVDGTAGELEVFGEPGGRHLIAGGGPSHFLLFCQGDHFGAHNLVDPSAPQEGVVTLITAGVTTPVEVASTAGAELAERAIRYFYTHGDIDPESHWA